MNKPNKNTARGLCVVKLGEAKQELRFNLNSFAILDETFGIKLSDFDKVMAEKPFKTLGLLAYSAYINKCDYNGEEVVYSEKQFTAMLMDDEGQINSIKDAVKSCLESMGKTLAPK